MLLLPCKMFSAVALPSFSLAVKLPLQPSYLMHSRRPTLSVFQEAPPSVQGHYFRMSP